MKKSGVDHWSCLVLRPRLSLFVSVSLQPRLSHSSDSFRQFQLVHHLQGICGLVFQLGHGPPVNLSLS
jgi:hypothetical protein